MANQGLESNGPSFRKVAVVGAIALAGLTGFFTGQTTERDRLTDCSAEITQEFTNPLRIVAVPVGNAIAEISYDDYVGSNCETNR